MGDTCLLHANVTQGSSWIWHAIVKYKDALKVGFICIISSGEVSFWYDKLVCDDYLSNLVTYVHITDIKIKVKCVKENVQWMFHRFSATLPELVKDNIRNASTDNNLKDVLIWIGL